LACRLLCEPNQRLQVRVLPGSCCLDRMNCRP
jgi:hypothetical protein